MFVHKVRNYSKFSVIFVDFNIFLKNYVLKIAIMQYKLNLNIAYIICSTYFDIPDLYLHEMIQNSSKITLWIVKI